MPGGCRLTQAASHNEGTSLLLLIVVVTLVRCSLRKTKLPWVRFIGHSGRKDYTYCICTREYRTPKVLRGVFDVDTRAP